MEIKAKNLNSKDFFVGKLRYGKTFRVHLGLVAWYTLVYTLNEYTLGYPRIYQGYTLVTLVTYTHEEGANPEIFRGRGFDFFVWTGFLWKYFLIKSQPTEVFFPKTPFLKVDP